MAYGSTNAPGVDGAELKQIRDNESALRTRVGNIEKTLSGREKIPGTTAPTAQVSAQVGQIYINTDTGEEWKCIAVNDSGTVWEKLKGSAVGLTAADVGARPDTWMPTAADVGARPDTWMPTAADVGARPSTWTPTAADVGARPSTWMPTAAEVGAVPAAAKGAANGVAALDAGGKVPASQLPSLCPFVAGTSAPADKLKLWIDTTANTGGLKYFNGSAWVPVPVNYT